MKKLHALHLVTPSPWPILASFCSFSLIGSTVLMLQGKSTLLLFSSFLVSLIMFSWWKDVFSESSFEGEHSKKTSQLLKTGMVFFITSEIFLFFSLFWGFFHFSSSANIELGSEWPPVYIFPFPVEEIPLLNTIILLSSGGTLTMAHHEMMNKNKNLFIILMKTTITLGLLFTLLQIFEYSQAKFNMADSSFGSIFFLATGFHGAHVIVGSIFLTISLLCFSSFSQFISFETSAWYWHFVDVVWLFLFVSIYWWGG